MGLITETNEEYYAGEKVFLVANGDTQTDFPTTFNTELETAVAGVNNANFKFEYSQDIGVTWLPVTNAIALTTTTTRHDTISITLEAYTAPSDTLFRITFSNNCCME